MSQQSGQLPADIVKVEVEEDDERTCENSSNTTEGETNDDKDFEMLKAVESLLSNGPWLSCGTVEGESLAGKLFDLGERLVGWKEWERLGRSKVEKNRKLTQRLKGAELQLEMVKESKAELRKTYEQEVEQRQKAEKEVVELKEKIAQTTSVTEAVQDVEVHGTASAEPKHYRGISVFQPADHSAPVIAAGIKMRTSLEESSSEEEGGILQQQKDSEVGGGSVEDLTGSDEAVPSDDIAGPRRSSRSVAEKTVEKQDDSDESDKDSDDGGDDTAQPGQSGRPGRTLDGGENRLKCDWCEVVLASRRNLNRHMENIHGEKGKRGRFPCYCCDEVFPYKSKFLRHLKTHPMERRYRCKTCSKISNSRTLLYLHVMRIHDSNREKNFVCSTCSKGCLTSQNLTTHMVTHQAEKPFKCSQCPQQFKRSDSLKSHLITHSGLTPFQCKLCEKRFRRKKDLEVHIRVHTGERPYSCNICDKTFKDSSHLHRHVRTHQGDQVKIHQCPHCSLKFARTDVLLKHHQRRHRLDSEVASAVAKAKGE